MKKEEDVFQQNEAIYASQDYARVRYKKRVVNDEAWMKSLLHRGAVGVLATSAGDQPFLNTHNYVYDEAGHCIYFHRSPVGRTSANLEHNPRLCYTVFEMGRMYAHAEAEDFSVEYRSMVIFGKAQRVGPEEAARALQMLVDKYAPHLKSGEAGGYLDLECMKTVAVFKIKIEQWSGKKNEFAPDKPGVYEYIA
jgi:hypothetical protein